MSRPSGAAAPVDKGGPSSASSSSPPPPYQPFQFPDEGDQMLDAQYAWKSRDPRSSSTQSLLPSLNEGRRTLLVIYIHGFMGNNTSFQSFPAHVHHYLREELSETHVIHSKVYPRYKTYKAIEVARDNFSKWLEPHEDENTDVVLIGHSMGGLLAADVALMPSPSPVYGGPLKHRILGTISLDAPLLGLHPGIIKSGIASLFRKAPDPPGREQELAGPLASQNASGSLSLDGTPSLSDLGTPSGMASPAPLSIMSSNASDRIQPDPNFNPAFFNDVPFVDRGWWKNVAHFAKKHYSDGLFSSTYQHLISHLEFGSCLADYSALNSRYNKIRRLEDVDELNQVEQGSGREVRVRFVNYYTVSTGIPKTPASPPASPPKRSHTHLRPEVSDSPHSVASSSQASTPRISIEDYSDSDRPQTLQLLEPEPIAEPDSETEVDPGQAPTHNGNSESSTAGPLAGVTVNDNSQKDKDDNGYGTAGEITSVAESSQTQKQPTEDEVSDPTKGLPEIPPLPEPPEAPDFSRYTDKDAKKQAEKEFKRVQKTYSQAVKNREKAVKERQKLVDKRQKKAQKESEKRQKEEAKRLAKEQQEREKQHKADVPREEDIDPVELKTPSRVPTVTPAEARTLERQLTDLAFHDQNNPGPSSPPTRMRGEKGKENAAAASKEKLHKFCMLPPKVNGRPDPAWVQVYMKGVDEVGAHCGLFFSGPHYEPLIGDVGGRIVGWVQNDASKRAILALD
ncbi:hypothetical protein VSDG_01853 [Cytospora chrysosperma]|uniref:DUF676 domain-containing protein n=1 Tax=Cytospora chrysosperma TaxID=252740 RepID=A0A423WH34_CYTCH|nr:hypothetical protein VSDG_01853 [Valsa sordida]